MDKIKYISLVHDLKKHRQIKNYAIGPILFVLLVAAISLQEFFPGNLFVIFLGKIVAILFVVYILLCVIRGISNLIGKSFVITKIFCEKSYRLEGAASDRKNKDKKSPRERSFNELINFIGFQHVPTDSFSVDFTFLKRAPFEYKPKLFKKGYIFDKIQIVNDKDENVLFHIDMPLPIKNDILVGDFSNNADLYPFEMDGEWHFFTPNRAEDFDWMTADLKKHLEDFLTIFVGYDCCLESVFLQFTPDGINGVVFGDVFPWAFEYIDEFLFKKDDVKFHLDYPTLYESACILENLNKYIESNKF